MQSFPPKHGYPPTGLHDVIIEHKIINGANKITRFFWPEAARCCSQKASGTELTALKIRVHCSTCDRCLYFKVTAAVSLWKTNSKQLYFLTPQTIHACLKTSPLTMIPRYSNHNKQRRSLTSRNTTRRYMNHCIPVFGNMTPQKHKEYERTSKTADNDAASRCQRRRCQKYIQYLWWLQHTFARGLNN